MNRLVPDTFPTYDELLDRVQTAKSMLGHRTRSSDPKVLEKLLGRVELVLLGATHADLQDLSKIGGMND